MKTKVVPIPLSQKARTGIKGFDEITHGGLPRARATLIEGGPGSGKTIMACNRWFMAHESIMNRASLSPSKKAQSV